MGQVYYSDNRCVLNCKIHFAQEVNQFQFDDRIETAASITEAAVPFYMPMRAVYGIVTWRACAVRWALWNVRVPVRLFFPQPWFSPRRFLYAWVFAEKYRGVSREFCAVCEIGVENKVVM